MCKHNISYVWCGLTGSWSKILHRLHMRLCFFGVVLPSSSLSARLLPENATEAFSDIISATQKSVCFVSKPFTTESAGEPEDAWVIL